MNRPPPARPGGVARGLLALLLVTPPLALAACGYMKAPWSPRPAAAGEGPQDTAAVDSAARGDTAAGGRAGGARRDSGPPAGDGAAPPDTSLPEGYPTVEQLREDGPTHTDYAVGPRLLPGDWLSDLLSATLAPVVDRNDDVSTETFALFWVLVDRDGEVRDAVLHTSSRTAPFDKAARAVAERLRYRPAVTQGRPVPVWVLSRVSLLMR